MNGKKEFAPGIPIDRAIQDIRYSDDDIWELAVQEHHAERAGKHYDLRLGDPKTQFSHSWALPRSTFPTDQHRIRLAVQQPTHTMDYMDFEGRIPSGYGKGDVKLIMRDKVNVKTEPDKIHLSLPDYGDMVLIRKDGNQWMMIKKKRTKTAGDILRTALLGKLAAFEMQNTKQIQNRTTPFKNQLSKKTKTPFKIKAPDITPPSVGKSDTGKIE